MAEDEDPDEATQDRIELPPEDAPDTEDAPDVEE